jgi:hypothetical protein
MMAYCIYEGNDKNVFGKKMKKNNFYKNIAFGEDEVYCHGTEEANDIIGIDYVDGTDYDYFSDLF